MAPQRSKICRSFELQMLRNAYVVLSLENSFWSFWFYTSLMTLSSVEFSIIQLSFVICPGLSHCWSSFSTLCNYPLQCNYPNPRAIVHKDWLSHPVLGCAVRYPKISCFPKSQNHGLSVSRYCPYPLVQMAKMGGVTPWPNPHRSFHMFLCFSI